MSVESVLVDMLQDKSIHGKEPGSGKVTIRLDPSDYEDLKGIAKTLGVNITTMSHALLRGAIAQSVVFLNVTQSEQRTEEEQAEGMRRMKGMVS